MAKQTKNYQTLSSELDDILAKLQSAEIDIDEALELYKKGQKIVQEIDSYLKTARTKVKTIKTDK